MNSPSIAAAEFDYWKGAKIVGGLAFLAAWIFASTSYGYLMGFGLGWIPALLIGAAAGLLWPFVTAGVVGYALLLLA